MKKQLLRAARGGVHPQELTVFVRNALEKFQHDNRRKVLLCLACVRLELIVEPAGVAQASLKRLLQLLATLFGFVHIMDKLEGVDTRHFLHCPIWVIALWTGRRLLAVLDDSLEHPSLGQRAHSWPTHFLEILSAGFLLQEYRATGLADALTDRQGVFEETDVEQGQLELHVSKVACAFRHFFVARLALLYLVGDPKPRVEHTVRRWGPLWHAVQLLAAHVQVGSPAHLLRAHEGKLELRDALRRFPISNCLLARWVLARHG
mmetsp:Transcript_27339/g.79720  ORF Transcript_27339/g.79720 Transcript_27339/m.79720 type:complete len:262 (+) Transcript_27339:193-978(+)